MSAVHPNTRRVIDAGAAAGVVVEPHGFPEGTRTAAAAAAAIGVTVGEIANSLVFCVDDETVLVLSSGAHRVDPEALARAAGGTRADRCPPDRVRTDAGFAIGAVAPFGHAKPLRVFCDRALLQYDVVWAAAGTADSCFPIPPADLVRATGAIVAQLAEGH